MDEDEILTFEDIGAAAIIPVTNYRDAWIIRFMAMASKKDYECVTLIDEAVAKACVEFGLVTVH